MEPTPALSVVIPVYNEGENITPTALSLLEKVHVKPLEILVVHDFDEDTTVPVVRELQKTHPELRLHRNDLGKGVVNALKAGLRASSAPFILVTMADASDDPSSIDAMYELAAQGADVVAGSRYMAGGEQYGGPPIKRTLSRLAGLSLHYVGGIPTHDATNSFKIYSRRLLEATDLESDGGFEIGIELTVKAHLMGMRVAEVPTSWYDRTAGQSRFKTRQWIPKYLRWYRRGILSRFSRRPAASR
ncbi:MAG: dolichol-phosphate mannosyltransferase [Chloroflexota bacterium]|jgi:glycosyltransferase involved in cell wall biosynthesis|nr:dolichol-phosphate mannosyltransferase [Chloroflexota bacterium]